MIGASRFNPMYHEVRKTEAGRRSTSAEGAMRRPRRAKQKRDEEVNLGTTARHQKFRGAGI